MFKALTILFFLVTFIVPVFADEPPVDIPSLRAKAEQGDAESQNALGHEYFLGINIKTDYIEAEKWNRKAAEQGNVWSQLNLGIIYEGSIDFDSGLGVKRDDVESAKWYLKAAEHGNSDGQHKIGGLYAKGLGVKQDLIQAYMWYTLANTRVEHLATREEDTKALAELATKMTPEQIEEAKGLAAAWKPTPAISASPSKP